MSPVRGYVRGVKAAANYCGISDDKTFRDWCRTFCVRPRLINGQAYFSLKALDNLMDPAANAPGSEEKFWNGTPPPSN